MNLALHRLRHTLLICIALGSFSPLPLAAHAEGPTKPDPEPARFDAEIRTFEEWDRKNSFPPGAVLFVGSSSIRMWPTAESFPGQPLINRGFGGSHVSDVNHFDDRVVLRYQPRVIILYAGDNDIADGKSPKQVFEDFQEFVKLVYDELPETRVVYLPIKPSIARWKLWPKMREVNRLIKELADRDDRLEYVDTATPMLGDDGRPRPELFLDDGLHMNRAGYEVWTAKLKPALAP